jgi:Kef-type K+ transport system membrane component KefB
LEENLTHEVTQLAFQLGIILIAAKLSGEFVERVLKQPSVLGELAAGIIIGPYALGQLSFPFLGPIFGEPQGVIPVSTALYSFAQIAAVILLFEVGLHTDLKKFLHYAPQATAVAIGGVVVPFILGDVATFMLLESVEGPFDYAALFMGTIMTATSVGVTARVLDEIDQLDSSEGVTIIGAAVVDDVIGIIVLAMVSGLALAGSVDLASVAVVGGKAVGFWLFLTIGGIALSKYIVRGINSLRIQGAAIAMSLALAFIAAAVAEMFGLAMIIGAYSVGLALSQTNMHEILERPLNGVYDAFVPVFFAVMGMMVDVPLMLGTIGFGLIIVALAIIGKLLGAGLPALLVGFKPRSALGIGIGMTPRAEVGLIVAGIGMEKGIIGAELFGVAILMTVATTVFAPIFLVKVFKEPVSESASPAE